MIIAQTSLTLITESYIGNKNKKLTDHIHMITCISPLVTDTKTDSLD